MISIIYIDVFYEIHISALLLHYYWPGLRLNQMWHVSFKKSKRLVLRIWPVLERTISESNFMDICVI